MKSNASIAFEKPSEISKFNHVHQKSKQLNNHVKYRSLIQNVNYLEKDLMPSTQIEINKVCVLSAQNEIIEPIA